MTRCSVCRRTIREKRFLHWGPPTAWLTDWLNHARTCSRYGQPPDTD